MNNNNGDTAPVTAAPGGSPTIEAAHAMGAKGGSPSEAERLAFEAWMRGHCWALSATWDGKGYVSDAEEAGGLCPFAVRTRGLWAAWRDRAALSSTPAAPGIDLADVSLAAQMMTWGREEGLTETRIAEIDAHQQKLFALIDASPKRDVHPDNLAVDAFAAAMKAKLAEARGKSRGGWQGDEPGMQQRLSNMLRDHIEKGDPRDVANFCMFLHQRGEGISPKGGSTDAQNAARYQWLRDRYDPSVLGDECGSLLRLSGAELDAAIDDELQATSAEVGA